MGRAEEPPPNHARELLVPIEENIFQLPVIETGSRPEIAQGVIRNFSIPHEGGTLSLWVTILSYLVQCWARLYHPGPLTPLKAPQVVTDQGYIDLSTKAGIWEVDLVTIDILKYPDGYDMQFGGPPFIYAGKGAFFRSALSDTQFDWLYENTIGWDKGFSGAAQINVPTAWGNQMTTGMTPLTRDVAQNNALDTQNKPRPATGGVSLSLWGEFKTAPKAKRFNLGIAANPHYHYPLVWFNHRHMAFTPPDVMANGFAYSFKPGVVARIQVWARPKNPFVLAGTGEGSHAGFNPLNGGRDS